MANLIETQRVYKILKKVIKNVGDKPVYEHMIDNHSFVNGSWLKVGSSKRYTVYHHGNVYVIVLPNNKAMTITHSERSVSWDVPKGTSVLSIQQAVI